MKVAVASEDGVLISHHFGRSRCFLIFETEEKQIIGRSVRDNSFTAHARGQCQEGQPHEHHHGHGAIIEALPGLPSGPLPRHGLAGGRGLEAKRHSGIRYPGQSLARASRAGIFGREPWTGRWFLSLPRVNSARTIITRFHPRYECLGFRLLRINLRPIVTMSLFVPPI